jgi:hypothetical protein
VYLGDAVYALRNAASSDALFDEPLRRARESERNPSWIGAARHEANARRIAFSRTAMLFCAFSAESYINEFIAWHFTGADLRSLDRLSTVEKYAVAPRLSLGRTLFARDSGPLQRIKQLFDLRDVLVHPKPGKGLPEQAHSLQPDPVFNPDEASKLIVAVADAAGVLLEHMAHGEWYDWEVRSVRVARGRFLAFGKRAAESLPALDDPPIAPYLLITLVKEASERRRDRATPSPDNHSETVPGDE